MIEISGLSKAFAGTPALHEVDLSVAPGELICLLGPLGCGKSTLPRPQVAARVAAALELVGLAGFDRRLPQELSGGQAQRVALARCLVVEPRVLLMDEPFSALDAHLRKSLREELKALQRRLGLTTIFVTHDQEEAMELADRIVVMRTGRIEQQGTPARWRSLAGPRTCGPIRRALPPMWPA
jgi:ABC-type Fe3+/spermidine/putrescine transport system ATPase subunit